MFLLGFSNVDCCSYIFWQRPVLLVFPRAVSYHSSLTWNIRFFSLRILLFCLVKSNRKGRCNRFDDIFFWTLRFNFSWLGFVLWILNEYICKGIIFTYFDFSLCFTLLLSFKLFHQLFEWRWRVIHIDSGSIHWFWWSSFLTSW